MCAQSWCPYILRAAETPLNWQWTVQRPDPQTRLRGDCLLWEALGEGRRGRARTAVTDPLAQGLCGPPSVCLRVWLAQDGSLYKLCFRPRMHLTHLVGREAGCFERPGAGQTEPGALAPRWPGDKQPSLRGGAMCPGNVCSDTHGPTRLSHSVSCRPSLRFLAFRIPRLFCFNTGTVLYICFSDEE